MVRVLQIVTKMDIGGLESRLMDIYRQIDKTLVQFDFYIFDSGNGYFDNEIEAMGGIIYKGSNINWKNAFTIPKKFCSFLLQHPEYAIVHCHMNSWCGFILKGAFQAGVPVRIAHARGAIRGYNIQNIFKNIIKRTVNKYATHRFSVSEKAAVWLFGQKTVAKGNVQIWPNAIDSSKYIFNENIRLKKRRELGLEGECVLMHVGNLTPPKNHTFLLEIFKQFQSIINQSVLLLVGCDFMNGAIHKKAYSLNCDECVIFLGQRTDVSELLEAADVFVFPSLHEGFPGAVLEAQAAGLPCVISDTISKEIKVTDLVKQLSLKEKPIFWAETIRNIMQIKRKNTYEQICMSGYDIKSLTSRLTDFYKGVVS